jgi:hypothetical protein
MVCRSNGLPVDKSGKLPDDIFGRSAVWPVYPEIGKRLNIEGSLTFRRPGKAKASRFIEIDQMVDLFYQVYDQLPREALVPLVKDTVNRLRAVGV